MIVTSSEDRIQDVLKPFHADFRAIIMTSFQQFREQQNHAISLTGSPYIFNRTPANIIFDFISQNASKILEPHEQVKLIRRNQTIRYVINNVIVRFKKGDHEGKGSNIRTNEELNFITPDTSLPFLTPKTSKIEVTYTLDELSIKVDGVFVVARDHDTVLWKYKIEESEIMPQPVDALEPNNSLISAKSVDEKQRS